METYCPNDCSICREYKEICFYSDKNLSWRCPICKKNKSPHKIYEYRGKKSCPNCFDLLKQNVDFQRQEQINKDKHIYNKYKGLDFGNNSIGKGNKEIFGL